MEQKSGTAGTPPPSSNFELTRGEHAVAADRHFRRRRRRIRPRGTRAAHCTAVCHWRRHVRGPDGPAVRSRCPTPTWAGATRPSRSTRIRTASTRTSTITAKGTNISATMKQRGAQRRLRLGVMGGTFDPIHHGHLVAASEVAAKFDLDEVVFVPTGQPWQKMSKKVSEAEHRYLMTVIATASNPRFTVSRVDVDRPGPDLHDRHPAGPAHPASRRRPVLHHRRRRPGPDPVLEGHR